MTAQHHVSSDRPREVKVKESMGQGARLRLGGLGAHVICVFFCGVGRSCDAELPFSVHESHALGIFEYK